MKTIEKPILFQAKHRKFKHQFEKRISQFENNNSTKHIGNHGNNKKTIGKTSEQRKQKIQKSNSKEMEKTSKKSEKVDKR